MNEEIKIIERESENTLEIQTRAVVCMFPKVIGDSYKRIMEKLEKENIKPSGSPYVKYINVNWQEVNDNKFIGFLKMFFKKWDMLIGFPVVENIKGENNLNPGMMHKGKYVHSLHTGPYQKIGKTYEKMISWIKEQKLEIMNECIEFYLNDPKTTKKENLETVVLIPVAE